MQQNENDLLERDLPQEGESNIDTPEWRQVLKMVERTQTDRTEKLNIVDKCTEMYEEQGDVGDTIGKSYVKGTTLFSAHRSSVGKMRPLQHLLYLHGAPSVLQNIVSGALDLGIKETGLLHALTGRFGAFHRALLHGDSFIMARKTKGKDRYPIAFDAVDVENIWIDPFAVDMQNDSSYQDVDECLITYDYSWDEFVGMYPEAEKKAMAGKLPMNEDEYQESSKFTWNQEEEKEDRVIQVGYYFNKSINRMIVFAGKQATFIEDGELEFKDVHGEPIIPVFHFVCFPTPRGFYNWGLAQLLYRYHRAMRQMVNAATSAVINRIDPIYYSNLTEEEQSELDDKVEDAMYQQAQGKGIVVIGFDKVNGMEKPTELKALVGEQLTGDFERLYQAYEREVQRLGINLDDVAQQAVDTATQATLKEQNANATVVQIMEENARMFERMYSLILDTIRTETEDTNNYYLRYDEDFVEEDLQIISELYNVPVERLQNMRPTLGFVKRILKEYPHSVDVELRSGAYPDIVTETAHTQQMVEMFGSILPGSPGHIKALKKFAKLRGDDYKESDFAMPQPETQGKNLPQMPQ